MKKSPEEIKARVRELAQSRDIVLFIDEKNPHSLNFYHRNRERMKITMCVTDGKKNKFLDEDNSIPIIEWKDYVGGENNYIVVTGHPFAHVENLLLASGMCIFEEYIDANLLEAILSDKKIAIMAGNCQLIQLYILMNGLKSFTQEYQFFRFSTHLWNSKWSLKSLSYLKSFCDLYICSRHEEGDPMYFSREELPSRCKVVVVPFAVIRLYWPQLKANVTKAVNEFFLADKSQLHHGPFEYGDININRMIKEGKSVEEIVKVLSDEEYYTEEQVQQHLTMVMRTLEYEEAESDIEIASYIREHYQTRMIYRDMVHMQIEIEWEMVKRILEYLGMDTAEVMEKRQDTTNKEYEMVSTHCTEIPIYPSVAKHLELEWCQKDTLYDVTFYNGIKKMTFEEYIRAYYSVCSKVKQMQEEW